MIMKMLVKEKKRYLTSLIFLMINTFAFPQQSNLDGRKGYQGLIEIGYAVGNEYEYRTDFIKLNLNGRYAFNPFFSMGLGGGIRFYYDEDDFMVPLYVSFQSNLPSHRNATPFLALSAGYLVDITTEFTIYDIVPMLNPSAGICFHVSGKTAMMIGIGYEMHRAKIFADWLEQAHPKYLSYFNLNLCFLFQNLNLFPGKSTQR